MSRPRLWERAFDDSDFLWELKTTASQSSFSFSVDLWHPPDLLMAARALWVWFISGEHLATGMFMGCRVRLGNGHTLAFSGQFSES
jgi:hypothetical protein